MDKKQLEQMVSVYLDAEYEDEKAQNTLKRYKYAINNFLKKINDEEITKKTVIDYKRYLIEHYKPSSVNNQIIIINKFIKYCEMYESGEYEVKKLRQHQSKYTVKTIKVQEKSSLEDVITKEEYRRMLRMAKKKNREDLYLIMRILAETGIRIGEMRYFTKENIEDSPYISVRNKGKTRDIIVDNQLRRDLLKYCEENKIVTGIIFDYQYHKVYRDLHWLAGQCRGINLFKIHPHAFRHLFATRFMEKVGDVTELKDILGHTNVNTTTIYSKSTKMQKKKHLEGLWKN